MPELAVTAIGRDRPGIVAAVTGSLLEIGGNIEDSQMSILGGHFAVMLLVRVPDDTDRASVSEQLAPIAMQLELDALSVAEVQDAAEPPRPTHVLSVYGSDHPGIVHAVASALVETGVNITDLETKLAGTPERPVYVMGVEVAITASTPADVENALERAAGDANVEVTLRELEYDAL